MCIRDRPHLMPDVDNNFGGSLGLDFRKWWRHMQPKNNYCLRLCIGHDLCEIKYTNIIIIIIIIFVIIILFLFFKREGKSDLHYSIVLFVHDISFIFMPGMTILMLGWLACPAWLFSLSLSFFTMPGMNIPCEPQSPSLSENWLFQKIDYSSWSLELIQNLKKSKIGFKQL